MILEQILLSQKSGVIEHTNQSFIKQYDAMLCYNSSKEIKEAPTLLDAIRDGVKNISSFVMKSVGFGEINVEGLNFIETADGDLYDHLLYVQKELFPEIADIENVKEYFSKFSKGQNVITYDIFLHSIIEYHQNKNDVDSQPIDVSYM